MLCPECGNHVANKVIRKLEETGQIGHTEQNVFTFNGNLDGRVTATYGENTFVKVSNSPVDLSTVTLVRGVSPAGVMEITPNDFGHDVNGNWEAILIDNEPLILSVTAEQYGFGPGLWFFATPGVIYVSYMEAPETITPMLPKYLPGVCLPVVEIAADPGAFFKIEDGGTPMTTEVSAQLDKAVALMLPLVIKFKTDSYNSAAVFLVAGTALYSDFYDYKVYFTKVENEWIAWTD